jgi:hypothetical protein
MKSSSNKEKFAVIDTQIWIYCCLGSQKGEDAKVLKTLKENLDTGKLKLILPETIEIEFNRKVEQELKRFRDTCEAARKEFSLAGFPSHQETIKKRINQIKREVVENFSDIKSTIKDVFNNENTIKTKITPEIMVAAQKRGMKGLKPYSYKNEGKTIVASGIQSDCLIVEEFADYFKGKSNYELFICSNNSKDFADKNSKLSKDISTHFETAVLYPKLSKFLNEEFKADIQEDKLSEQPVALDLDNLPPVWWPGLNLPDNLVRSTATLSSIQSAATSALGTITNLQQAIGKAGAVPNLVSALASTQETIARLGSILPQFTCSECGLTKSGTPYVGSLCLECSQKKP